MLEKINKLTNAKCYGIDASRQAIKDGKKLYRLLTKAAFNETGYRDKVKFLLN